MFFFLPLFKRKKSVALFEKILLLYYLKRSAKLLLPGRWSDKVASKSVRISSLAKLNSVRFELPALSLDWLQPLPKS